MDYDIMHCIKCIKAFELCSLNSVVLFGEPIEFAKLKQNQILSFYFSYDQ